MSLSVDLWNGFDAIKTQIFSVQKKLRNIQKAITTYLTIETTYNKSLENLYKEFKDIKVIDKGEPLFIRLDENEELLYIKDIMTKH